MTEYHSSIVRRTDGEGKKKPKLQQTAELRAEREGFNILVKSCNF